MPSLNGFTKDPVTGYLVALHATSGGVFGSESKKRLLQLIEETGNMGQACDTLGISTRTLYDHLAIDEAFVRDYGITLKRMASKLESTMFQNGQKPNGYMDRITWLRRWFPRDWTPKTQITVDNQADSLEPLFDSLRASGRLIDVKPLDS